jgi:hypothetical protein
VITTETDTTDVVVGLLLVESIFSESAMSYYARRQAEYIIERAVKAPIPYDTGDLSRSSKIVDSGTGAVTFGFTVEYAAIQDQGSVDGVTLPPKRFGSKKGPNFYLSGTIKKYLDKILARIGNQMKQDLKTTLGAFKKVRVATNQAAARRRKGLTP